MMMWLSDGVLKKDTSSSARHVAIAVVVVVAFVSFNVIEAAGTGAVNADNSPQASRRDGGRRQRPCADVVSSTRGRCHRCPCH